MQARRVVVTGMGTVNPLGLTVEEFWNNLLAGVSGADHITTFDTSHFKTTFACMVKGFDAANYFDRKSAQRMDPFCRYGVAASTMAIADAGIQDAGIDPTRIGVILGSGIGGLQTHSQQSDAFIAASNNPRVLSPFFVPMMISDILAGHVSILFGLQGPNYAITSACATSSHCIGDAAMLIQRGMADVMVTGGSEAAVCQMGVGGFNAMRALSTRNDDPKTASRPFDKDRDGFVMGEGAGVLVLEELEHARARGARIYAEIAGIGFSADAYHITEPAPEGNGAVRSMQMALNDAEMNPVDVQLINAHGTSTFYNDKNETAAIKTVFGDHVRALKVNSTKSMTGHLLGAAGAVESIATIKMIMEDRIHPTINQVTPDPECDLDYVPNTAIDHTVNAAITNTFGFGGHNTSLLFKKFKG